MAKVKGTPKTGGRIPGSINKSTLPLQERCAALGVDPFLVLIYFVRGDWKSLGYESPTKTMYSKDGSPYEVDIITVDHRLKATSEACGYIYPKRKAIEMQATIDHAKKQVIEIQWADENDPSENAAPNPATKTDQPIQ